MKPYKCFNGMTPFIYESEYKRLNKSGADCHFKNFISSLPERLDYFCLKCVLDLQIKPKMLDYSADSLHLVWSWFL